MGSGMEGLLTSVCPIHLSDFLGWTWVRKVAIWCSREAVMTVEACESHDNASGVIELSTKDDDTLIQLLKKFKGAASKDGGLR
jgi:hypothetical protein